MKIFDIYQMLRNRLGKGEEIQLTASVDSTALLGMPLQTELILLDNTDAQQLARAPRPVFNCTIQAGPVADGTTANAGNVFVGNAGVSARNGFTLPPAATLDLGNVDLQNVYVRAANANDAVRVIFQAA